MASVSYSEASSYLLCKRKHFYGYTRSLQRITTSTSLALGSAGHKILETFYNVILAAGDTKAKQLAVWPAALAAARVEHDLIMKDFVADERKATLEEMLFQFYFPNEPLVKKGWLIQAVEMEFRLDVEVSEGVSIETPFVIDLIAVSPEGKTVVIDHKFVYNFYTVDGSQLQPQIPLYMAGLRGLGHKVDEGMYNMVRNMKIVGLKNKATPNGAGATLEQRLLQLPITPSAARVVRTFEDQIDTAIEIQALKLLTLEEVDRKSHRVANEMVCKSCSFADLCKIELSGGNAALVERAEFKVRERRTFDVASVAVGDDEE